MRERIEPARRLRATVRPPGDKSIAHRALLIGALAGGESRIEGLPDGADVASTARCLRAMGVGVERLGVDGARLVGVGLRGLSPPAEVLHCGNSGTSMRLLAGIVAGQAFEAILEGDASLRRRPMSRVAEPLRAMGARLQTGPDGTAPLRLRGGALRAVRYQSPVASAQVKSCVLLAGLFADGETAVTEPRSTRDHTERMLESVGAGVRVDRGSGLAAVQGGGVLRPLGGRLPGDISSAAYWLAAAALSADSEVDLLGVGTNPTRTAILGLLRGWGADIEVTERDPWQHEPVADLRVRSTGGALSGGRIDETQVAGLIDELPLLALLGPLTERGVEVEGAGELRVKESDRIATACAAVRALGGRVDEFPSGFAVHGGTGLRGGTVDAAGDHRIALAAAAVSVACSGPTCIEGSEAAAVSYPSFVAELRRAAGA